MSDNLVTVYRFDSDDECTRSLVLWDGRFICFGLEPEYRLNKVAGETRIPSGVYTMSPARSGSIFKSIRKHFGPALGEFALAVDDVPNFKHIRVHCGNLPSHTAGCLIVGESCMDQSVGSSRAAYRIFAYPIVEALNRKEVVRINYIDADGNKTYNT